MTKFAFAALPAGPPSRRNWYKELLDDPGCQGNATRVQEAYEAHRTAFFAKQIQAFKDPSINPVTPDHALIKHLARQKRQDDISEKNPIVEEVDLDSQEVNCCVIWARPPTRIISWIQSLQQELTSFLGATSFHAIPPSHLHLSIIELSHRHSVPHLKSTVEEIGTTRIQNILDIPYTLDTNPSLTSPQISADKMGVAINFLPASTDTYTYHHLRSDAHALALESGVGIDMCYTAPSAHITLGRFIGSACLDAGEARLGFVELVGRLNERLSRLEGEEGTWRVGSDVGLEMQLGYVKFGRERAKAGMLGRS